MEKKAEKEKLLYVLEAMGGGVFTYIVDLANELADTYDIYIAYATRPQTPSNYKECFDKRICLIEVRNFVREINPVSEVRAFWELRRIVRKICPDYIHLHSSKAGIIGRWAFNGRKIPLFYTPHGYSFLMKNCGGFRRNLFKFIEVISARRACTTISCSEGEHRETLKFTKHAEYIDNGVNIEELSKDLEHVKISEHSFTVFTLGRVCYQKNPKLFNAIAEMLPDIHFLWIGDGEELKSELTAPNIEITGWVDRRTALRRSMNADVFLLTSLWEGLPMSLLEAMFMKKVCVVSNVIGNHDVIKNGKNGFVCDRAEQYKSAIEQCQDGNMSELIENAYHDILVKYNTKIMAEKYSENYQKSKKYLSGRIVAGAKEDVHALFDIK